MNFYFIRHAKTEANISGSMVKDYSSYGILPFNNEAWYLKVGNNLPKDFVVYTSPSKRCIETAKALFGNYNGVLDNLKEFDCSGLGEEKFWEISEERFNQLVHLNREDMESRIMLMFKELYKQIPEGTENIVLVTHGMYTRFLYTMLNRTNETPYEVINSKNYKFGNLDMLVWKNNPREIKTFNFEKIIERG